MTIDLHLLVEMKLDWDDAIPENLRSIWISNFHMIQEMKNLKYKRAVVPEDAVNVEINTLDFGDASQSMACSAIYARFLRKNGEYSSQLVFSRSKIIPDGTSIPRAELIAALLNTHTGEVVRRAFGKYHQNHIKLCDSEIVLHWLKNEDKPLKQWVRNRVLEVKRFTQIEDWYHVDSKNMIADIGTRKGSSIADVDQDSLWINGLDWMKKSIEEMPLRSVNNITLNQNVVIEIKKEENCNIPVIKIHNNFIPGRKLPEEIQERYEFSRYVIDPNRHRFDTIIRIMALVYKYINCLRNKASTKIKISHFDVKDINISPNEIKQAKMYFYMKATEELKHFNEEKHYSKFTVTSPLD